MMIRETSMRRIWLLLALLTLSACASNGYRYHDDGYWTARSPARSSVVFYGSISSCWGWQRPVIYPWYGSWASPCNPYSHPFGGGWYSGHGYGYGYNPYWNDRWYLPRTLDQQPAGSRARALAAERAASLDSGGYPRYDDLAPTRQRDTGGGGRIYRSQQRSYAPDLMGPRRQGLGSVGSRGGGEAGIGRSGLGSSSMGARSAPTRSAPAVNMRGASSREREEN